MFDLNESVQEWRKQLSGTGCCYAKDIEELEAHLREETEHLKMKGLTEEEGFLVARHRLGEAGAVGREFSKVNPWAVWRFRIFWMAVGVLALNLFGLVFSLADFIAVTAVQMMQIPPTYLSYSAILSKMVACGLGVCLFWFVVHRINRKQQSPAGEVKTKPLSRILVATVLLGMAGGVFLIKILCQIGVYRLFSIEDLSSFLYANAWFTSLGSILFNLFLAGVVIYLYPRMFRASETA